MSRRGPAPSSGDGRPSGQRLAPPSDKRRFRWGAGRPATPDPVHVPSQTHKRRAPPNLQVNMTGMPTRAEEPVTPAGIGRTYCVHLTMPLLPSRGALFRARHGGAACICLSRQGRRPVLTQLARLTPPELPPRPGQAPRSAVPPDFHPAGRRRHSCVDRAIERGPQLKRHGSRRRLDPDEPGEQLP
jgi:hypothetical protein